MSESPRFPETVFISSEPLYRQRGVYLDLSRFPLIPERLLDIVTGLKALRLNLLVVHWGDLFPWSFEERIQSDYVYPEQVISGFYHRLKAENIDVHTCVPAPDHCSFLLRLKSFAYLRKTRGIIDCLDISLPGALQLVTEMIEDIMQICGTTKFFIESDGCGTNTSRGARVKDLQWEKSDMLSYYNGLIDAVGSVGTRPVFQVPRDFDDRDVSALRAKTALAGYPASPSEGTLYDWALVNGSGPLTEHIPSRGSVLILWSSPGGRYTEKLPDITDHVLYLVRAASFFWNGAPLSIDIRPGDLRSGIMETAGAVSGSIELFERAVRDIYDLSIRMKNAYSFLRSLRGDEHPCSLFYENLMDEADVVMEKARRSMLDCLAASKPVFPSGWIEQWCNLKLLSAFEDITGTKLRLRHFIDLQGSTGNGL